MTVVTFLDLSKAFDCLQYDKLFYKLDKLGFSTHTLAWFQSYLSKRTQIVDLNGTISHQLDIVLYCIVFQGPQPHDTYDWTKGRAWMTAHCPDPRPLPRGLPPSSGLTSNSIQPGPQVLWCLRPSQSLNCFCFFSSSVPVFFSSHLLLQIDILERFLFILYFSEEPPYPQSSVQTLP